MSRASLAGLLTALAAVMLVLAFVADARTWLTVSFVVVVLVLVFFTSMTFSSQKRRER